MCRRTFSVCVKHHKIADIVLAPAQTDPRANGREIPENDYNCSSLPERLVTRPLFDFRNGCGAAQCAHSEETHLGKRERAPTRIITTLLYTLLRTTMCRPSFPSPSEKRHFIFNFNNNTQTHTHAPPPQASSIIRITVDTYRLNDLLILLIGRRKRRRIQRFVIIMLLRSGSFIKIDARVYIGRLGHRLICCFVGFTSYTVTTVGATITTPFL